MHVMHNMQSKFIVSFPKTKNALGNSDLQLCFLQQNRALFFLN